MTEDPLRGVTVLSHIRRCQAHSAAGGLEVVYGNIWSTLLLQKGNRSLRGKVDGEQS